MDKAIDERTASDISKRTELYKRLHDTEGTADLHGIDWFELGHGMHSWTGRWRCICCQQRDLEMGTEFPHCLVNDGLALTLRRHFTSTLFFMRSLLRYTSSCFPDTNHDPI